MDSLTETKWDVVISGTGLPQSLLALSLARSKKKVLHLDRNQYYGGFEAAFSLEEAEKWQEQVTHDEHTPFSAVRITIPTESHSGTTKTQLGPSRSYTLTLSPQLLYAQSTLLPVLVTSRVHDQLEFLAVGSWWICKNGTSQAQTASGVEHSGSTQQSATSILQKIPSGREDVFSDTTISVREKRALMRFLRHVLPEQADREQVPSPEISANSLADVLSSQFNIPLTLHQPILALSLSQDSVDSTNAQYAMNRIRRHLRSIGMFGPGFGSMIVKYGGGAEIAQVGCRAGAVGGGVYVLGRSVENIETKVISPAEAAGDGPSRSHLLIRLSDGETICAKYAVGDTGDLGGNLAEQQPVGPVASSAQAARSISIVSSPLTYLFPPTSDFGPIPAGAVVVFGNENPSQKDNSDRQDKSPPGQPPIYLVVHSSDSGECPTGQSVIYSSTGDASEGYQKKLADAVERLLSTADENPAPTVLWSMSYLEKGRAPSTEAPAPFAHDESGLVMSFPQKSLDLAFDDTLVDSVKAVWTKIMGVEADDAEFLCFEEREITGDDLD